MTVGELFVSLNVETSKFEASMQQSLTKTQGFVKSHEAQFKKVGMAVTAAGAAITGALGLAVKSYATTGEAVHKMALRTGLSTEAISELSHAANLSGTSIEGLEKGIKKMQMTIAGSDEESMMARRSLEALGLTMEQMKGKTPEEQFNLILEALAGVEDSSKKAALASEIFGRAGTQLLPMLEDGTEGLKAMRKEAHDLGLVMDMDAAKSAAAFDDSLTRLKGSFAGIQRIIAEQIIPILTPFIEKVTVIIKKMGEWMNEHPVLTKVLILGAAAVGILATALGPLIMALPFIVSGITTLTTILPMLGVAFTVITGPIGLIILAITALIAAGILLIKNWDKVKEGAQIIWDGIVSIIKGGVNLFISFVNILVRGVLGGVNLIIRGLNKIPKVNIPEISIPQIPTLHDGGMFRAPTPGGEGLALLRDREQVIPAGVTDAIGTEGGVKTIQVNNPLSPDDLQKIIRIVRRDTDMRNYIKKGLAGA